MGDVARYQEVNVICRGDKGDKRTTALVPVIVACKNGERAIEKGLHNSDIFDHGTLIRTTNMDTPFTSYQTLRQTKL
ncbi:hypothetical protein MAR_006078 [Mya arenaria]|uniref:Uncharacterized protein n=1 Tax=Mya arenaria TaxID=6604 RepID=A0ABY7D7G0_MYAAR|nr:hypothetical protein MAR_006078 [Mya arenaria]